MSESAQMQVTVLLERINTGDPAARDHLMELVNSELRAQAAGLMRHERKNHTLQPTALVNEAMVRLLAPGALENARNRAYFFAAAAQSMRQVLVDHARQRRAAKRGAGMQRVPLDDMLDSFEQQNTDVIALHEALNELERMSARQAQIVTLRFFSGLTMPEIADHLAVSLATVENDYRVSRAWLHGKLAH